MFIVFQTIPINFHKRSDSMEITSLILILLRTKVYDQSRQCTYRIYFLIDGVEFFQKNQSCTKERCFHPIISYLISSDRNPPGGDLQHLPVLNFFAQSQLIMQVVLRNENYMAQKMVVAECQQAELSHVQILCNPRI